MKIFKIIVIIVFLIFAGIYTISSRYEIEVLGKSRDACLRLDKWTGKIELIPIDSIVYKGWVEKQREKVVQ